jgi:hypothetical protein
MRADLPDRPSQHGIFDIGASLSISVQGCAKCPRNSKSGAVIIIGLTQLRRAHRSTEGVIPILRMAHCRIPKRSLFAVYSLKYVGILPEIRNTVQSNAFGMQSFLMDVDTISTEPEYTTDNRLNCCQGKVQSSEQR